MNFQRVLQEQLTQSLFKGKTILVYGPRQVGKTTLVQAIIAQLEGKRSLYITCDDYSVRNSLVNATAEKLSQLFSGYELVVIDEAQRVTNIGLTLKLIHDTLPQVQVVATGSYAFELANKISEPLTGRKHVFTLYPISRGEYATHVSPFALQESLEQRMIRGSYPEIIKQPSKQALTTLVDSYLYKDILEHQKIKKSDELLTLLQAIALQLGSEVLYHELAQIVGIDPVTVQKYIGLLEQSFVIFRLHGLSRNLRNELKKTKKIYFRDCGVRNALLNAFNPLNLRNDVGGLRENFFITERMKFLHYTGAYKNTYFWTTKQQQEIDYLEEENNHFDAFEIKRNTKKVPRLPKPFVEAYNHTMHHIHPENFSNYL